MGNGMNRVLPGLYVGNYRDSKDAGQLERHKITHIIAIHDAARRLHTDKEYLCIMASDTPYQNLAQYFPACNDFIHTARIEGGNVLIHCLAGMSRSVTIVVAYIMSITSLRWNEALKVVRGARAVSNPNSGFQKQLQEFETNKLAEERKRLLEKFPGTTQQEHEEENCRRLLIAYDHLLLSRAICDGRCTSARVCPTGTCRAHCASPRLSRQKSRESSVGSPRGSTKSLDTSGNEPPPSPKNWERHYGCWKNHFRHRQGTNSTPNSPILYRASSSKAQRSDSMLSISSVSSVTSLPGQMCIESREPSPYNISLVDRNPLLSTQSCPNSPRRVPRKMPQSGLSQADAARVVLANKEIAKKTSSAISNTPFTTSTSSLSKSPGVLLRPAGSSSSSLSALSPSTPITSSTAPTTTTTTATTTSIANSSTSTATGISSTETPTTTTTTAVLASSSSSSSSWGTPPSSNPCHRFMAHNASSGSTSSAASSTAKNFVKVSGGITRWVMKRSAYKYTLDKS